MRGADQRRHLSEKNEGKISSMNNDDTHTKVFVKREGIKTI